MQPKYFWWLSDSYRALGDYSASQKPIMAIDYYYKSLNNKAKVIELDGRRLCYSYGVRDLMLDMNRLIEKNAPETLKKWYQRWVVVAESCQSLCNSEQIMEHQGDIQSLRDKV